MIAAASSHDSLVGKTKEELVAMAPVIQKTIKSVYVMVTLYQEAAMVSTINICMAATTKFADPNLLQSTNFAFRIKRMPTLSMTVQNVKIPGVSVSPPQQPNPFKMIPHSGEQADYDPLRVTFIVTEDLENWIEIYHWLTGLSKPKTWDQYRELAEAHVMSGEGIESDLDLFLLSSHRNPKIKFTFEDAFPSDLSSLRLASTDGENFYIVSTVTFQYKIYTIHKMDTGESY